MNRESLEHWLNDETYIMAYRFNYDSAREFNEELKQYVRQLQQSRNKAIECLKNYIEMIEEYNGNQEGSVYYEIYNKILMPLLILLRGEDNE